MTQVQTGPTDAQLVALALRLEVLPASALNTWAGVGRIQAAMAGLGWDGALTWWTAEDGITRYDAEFVFEPTKETWKKADVHDCATAPDAVALAACAALGLPTEEAH